MNVNYKTIKEWAEEDRPREKLVARGKSNLTSAELLAILIGSGNTKESALDLSKKILERAGSLRELGRKEKSFYLQFKGIGIVKAVTIIAALELGVRRQIEKKKKEVIIRCSKDVYELTGPPLENLTHEEFWVLSLNRKNQVLSKDRIGQGGMHQVIVDPKIVFKTALNNKATQIILIHNHPSGQITPSEQDKNITSKLVKASYLLEIPVLDHVIIGHNDYYSFADSIPEYMRSDQ